MTTPRKNKGSSTIAATSVVSIAMVLFMMGLLMLVVWFGKKKSDELKEKVELTLFFKTDASGEDIQRVRQQLRQNEMVKDVEFRSAEDVAQAYAAEVGKDFIEVIGYNPLGAELVVKLKSAYATDANLIKLKATLIHEPATRDIEFKSAMLDQINVNVQKISMLVGGALVVFLLISIALINGTIRLQIYSRRFLIKSMQLVGATKWFITRPFIYSSMGYGFYGAVLSWIFLGGMMYGAYSYDPQLEKYYTLEELAILASFLLVLGIVFTCISSFFVTRRYLKLNIEQLY